MELERDLAAALQGEVRFDDAARAMFAADASNYRQVPIGVAWPRDAADVEQAVEICRRHGAPIVPRGAGTSLAGQCCNVAVVLDLSRHMRSILEIDPDRRIARVEPGVVLDHLREAAEKFGLTFGPDPATHRQCTLGGMIGNNSCGVHSVAAGRTAENVEELEVLTYDGLRMRAGRTTGEELSRIAKEGGQRAEIYTGLRALAERYAPLIRERYPKIPRCVSGYNLPALLEDFNVGRSLVGTEGTCALVLEAKVKLMPSPRERVLVVVGFPDVYEAGAKVAEILTFGPIGLEGIDEEVVRCLKKRPIQGTRPDLLPEGAGWLLVEFPDGDRAERFRREFRGYPMRRFDDRGEQLGIWKVRESALSTTARTPGEKDKWEGWEDAAVDPSKLGPYLRDLRKLFAKHGYVGALYGHFGDGCVHTRNDFDLETQEGIQKYRAYAEEAAELVVRYGGSLSGEHGDGQSRAELLPRMFGEELVGAFREFKAIWDPSNKMNPGKKIDAYRLDQNLRLGAGFRYARPETHFQFRADDGSFARATGRCIGVGLCRREEGGTMCPSYMATRDETHSTRGRAHLLFEMLQGNLKESEEKIRESLDLCLACKGCKSDCPMHVDMATYKAEFLSRYYEGRFRPRSAYAMGLVYWWARAASRVPRLANFFTQTPGLRSLVRLLGGVSQRRKVPRFATETFRDRFRPGPAAGRKVLLWPDTLTNYFQPEIALAAAEALSALGFEVEIPPRPLCCGRPLYDYGWLELAKKLLREILKTLDPWIERGIPVVVLEPSCLAVFRDEMPDLLPDVKAARLAEQSFLFGEFLSKNAIELPKLPGRAIVHAHCHQRALAGTADDENVLRRLGVEHRMLDSGCCGMAGAFGFEAPHYDVSMSCAERVLLPAVRGAGPEDLLISDGFSCREQIAQATGRRALHLAQVVRKAIGAKA